MISEKQPPELARELNEMTTILSRDHSEKDWKWSVLRVLRAMASEILKPPMFVVNPHDQRLGPVTPGPADDGGLTMKKIVENLEKRGPHREFKPMTEAELDREEFRHKNPIDWSGGK